MRLANFIIENVEPILLEWDAFARGIMAGARMNAPEIRDHAREILLATVEDMRSVPTPTDGDAKSGRRGLPHQDDASDDPSEQHAIGRLGSGFDLLELVSEYRALRASVLRLWRDSGGLTNECDVDDVTLFNESIDKSLARAVSSYTKRIDQSRDLFLAILGHDLRNPLSSIAMSASLLPHLERPATEVIDLASQIATDAGVMGRMISDLLDYTRTRLGAGMPVSPEPMDLAVLCQELQSEFRSAHPRRDIQINRQGEFGRHWDIDRLRQAISNLLGNAIQHSPANAPIAMRLHSDAAGVVLVVFNGGPPIPPGELAKIFDPMVRGSSAGQPRVNRPGSLGLGLYIARAIVESHGGTISVASSAAEGTAFTVRLPRQFVTHSGQPILDEKNLRTM